MRPPRSTPGPTASPSLRLVGDVARVSVPRERAGVRPATTLRLSDAGGPVRMASAEPRSVAHAERSIAEEMQAAASLSALDVRWIFAVQVSRELTGGRAAILTPECRDRLMTIGRGFGLRPFDASLIIAIVQDAARSGEDELGRIVTHRLSLIRPGRDFFSGAPSSWTRVLAHAALLAGAAVMVASLLVLWITRA